LMARVHSRCMAKPEKRENRIILIRRRMVFA
jgi:hypothetical protein